MRKKIVIDILMFILMLLEYSKLYTGQLLHEVFGILLLILFILHNILNIKFYKELLKGKYNLQRITITVINFLLLMCLLFAIILAIPISESIFKFLNLSANMTVRKLHTIFGYWSLILMSIHLGLNLKILSAKIKNKVKERKIIKIILYIIELIIVALGIKAIIDTNLGLYLVGKASFAIPTNAIVSFLNNFCIVATISIITNKLEKILKRRKEDF